MRFAGFLLSLLLCLGAARPACALPMEPAQHAMAMAMPHTGLPAPHRSHDHAAMVDCVGCAIGRIESAAPVGAPGLLARIVYRAAVPTRLAGRTPSLRAPPPRLAV